MNLKMMESLRSKIETKTDSAIFAHEKFADPNQIEQARLYKESTEK